MPPRKHKNKKKNHHNNTNNNNNQQQKQQQQTNHSNKQDTNSTTTTTTTTTITTTTIATTITNERTNQFDSDELAVINAETSQPYVIESSEIVGRCLVANRNLKPGELIITEKPLAIGPCVSADAVCLGCYKPIELIPTQYRCKGCKWPLCSSQCHGIHHYNGHTKYECDFLKQRPTTAAAIKSDTSLTMLKNLYELILIVRILLMRQHDAEKYARILVMESHLDMRRKNDELWQHYELNVVERLQKDWKMMEDYTADEIHRICGILDVNCFEIGQNFAKARTLYPSAFLLAHDCSPNTSHTDDPQTFEILLRTSRHVRKGEAITLSYAYTLQGTLKRRDFMNAGKLFWCRCQRCADPFELGSDCSAIICPKCIKGSIRSTDPLEQEAEWNCDNCIYKLTSNDIVKLLDRINDDLESIDVHNIPALEKFLQRYGDILRPNHYLLLSVKYSLCQIYGRIEGYLLHHMSIDDIKRKERYCREFLSIIDLLEPGLTRLRGLIMYELHAPIMVLAQHELQTKLINRKEFEKRLHEVVKLLVESRDILKLEPPGSNEHSMGSAAADALKNMGVQ